MEENAQKIFTKIYHENKWGNKESVSGSGSTIHSTRFLLPELEHLFKRYNIKSMLDLPCGDFNWMKQLNLNEIKYHGADIVEPLIMKNKQKYEKYQFSVLNLIKDKLPEVDLIFCRDCLFHLPNNLIKEALKNIKKSGSKYLLTTTYSWKHLPNMECKVGQWRRLNLELEPFLFPAPIELIVEGTYRDKSMGLWLIENIPSY